MKNRPQKDHTIKFDIIIVLSSHNYNFQSISQMKSTKYLGRRIYTSAATNDQTYNKNVIPKSI